MSGRALPLDRLSEPAAAARAGGLSVHLDGARFFNAVTKLGVTPAELAAPVDSVSICLSKGLGAPVGSVLVGPEDLIKRARRIRKMLGGGMRQAGVLAAAGLYALERHAPELAHDHARAARLAEALNALPGLEARYEDTQTNMVFLRCEHADGTALQSAMKERGVLIGGGSPWARLVVHRDVGDADLDRAIDAFEGFSRRN